MIPDLHSPPGSVQGPDAGYREALAGYLRSQDEAALSRAYEIGRLALGEGRGLLDLAQIHQDAMLAEPPSAAADAFFRELLSPYEMALRGYREANEKLLEANLELVKQKEAVEAANLDLESFGYSASHDLRAPLNIIQGYTDILLEDNAGQLNDAGRHNLAVIQSAVAQMAGLIQGLLSLSRLARGDLRREKVALTELARAIAYRLQEASPGRQAQFTIAPGLWVDGEHDLLTALLENLMGNAWKFSSKKEKTLIEFGFLQEGERRIYFVKDNGSGFDMANAEKLFKPFQRLHSFKDFEGHGIGLATVQRVVQWHGGRIWAESKVNEGATFFFTLDGGGAPA
jgi:light-regulated signal transduction histidine kinase (bacteriophytochrome)